MRILLILAIGLLLFSCSEDKINVSHNSGLQEPDKKLQSDSEIEGILLSMSKEITVSDSIELCSSGKKLINCGTAILKTLQLSFADSTETGVYSKFNHRYLSYGELAIIVADNIKSIPIARVVRVQQCTPPFDFEIEGWLNKIADNPEQFRNSYSEWRSSGGLNAE